MSLLHPRIPFLDTLRGIGAAGVAIWHYQHFFVLSGSCADSIQEGICNGAFPPLYPILQYFYENGFRMVDLFFMISGLVMFARYQKGVSAGMVTFKQFLIARVARLWPLAIATLSIAALLTWSHRVVYGSFLFYENNDVTTFVLNGLFLHAGFFRGVDLSFNGPSWTIAIEFWMYLSLFLVLRFTRRPLWAVCALSLGCVVLQANHDHAQLSLWYRGLSGFGIGMAIALVRQQLLSEGRSCQKAVRALTSVAVFGTVIVATQLYFPQFDVVTSFSDETRMYLWHLLVIFLPIVLSAALSTGQVRTMSSVGQWLGSRSFGIYMWHVPVQMALVLMIRLLGVNDPTFSDWFLATYVVVVLIAADVGFRLIERPLRSRILRTT